MSWHVENSKANTVPKNARLQEPFHTAVTKRTSDDVTTFKIKPDTGKLLALNGPGANRMRAAVAKQTGYVSTVLHQPLPSQSLSSSARRLGITPERFYKTDLQRIVLERLSAPYADLYDARPLAVIIAAKRDRNNAFSRRGYSQWELQKQSELQDLMKFYRVLYYEVKNECEAATYLKQATRLRKAHLIILQGHGTQTSLVLGGSDPAQRNSDDDAAASNSEKLYLDVGDGEDLAFLKNCIVDGGHIVLDSCSNAKGGRYADNMVNFISRLAPSAFVHGMDRPASLSYYTKSNGMFVGIRSKKGNVVVVNRDQQLYITYNPRKEKRKFPHPPVLNEALLKKSMNKICITTGMMPQNKATRVIGSPHDSRFVPRLMRALKHRDELLRLVGFHVLKLTAHPHLSTGLTDDILYVRRAAAEALGNIKDARTIPALMTAVKYAIWIPEEVITALSNTKDSRAIPPLIAILKRGNVNLRIEAINALSTIKDRRAVLALIAVLQSENENLRESAAEALGKIKDPRAAPALIDALRDLSWRVRWKAAKALGKIKDIRAVPVLNAALKDRNRDVQLAAKTSLGKINTPRIEIGLAGAYGAQINANQSFSGGMFGRYVFTPFSILSPFIQLSANGGRINDDDPLNYGGIKAGGGFRVRWGKIHWAYSSIAFLAGPAFTNRRVQAQLSGEAAVGIRIPLSHRVSLMFDLLSIGYNAIMKNKDDIKHDLSAQTRLAVQF